MKKDSKEILQNKLIFYKERLKNIRLNLRNYENILSHQRSIINENLYRLGNYCASHLCENTFDCSFALGLINDIEFHQKIYDSFCKENSNLREVESIVLDCIESVCKRLGIENV